MIDYPQEVEAMRQEKIDMDIKLRSMQISGPGMPQAGPYYPQRRNDRGDMEGWVNICCPRDAVSRHNGGTSGAPLKPLRVDSALRALSTLRGLRVDTLNM